MALVQPPHPEKPVRTFVCAYDFTDLNDELVFQHVRYATDDARGKAFAYRYRDGKTPGWTRRKPPHADDYLYRLPDVDRAVGRGHDIFWAEGEKDADNLHAAGVVATSHHGGARKVTFAQAAWLREHFGRVYLLMDCDGGGKPDEPNGLDGPGATDALLRLRLLREVGLKKTQAVILRPRVGKDVSDHLAAGFGVQDLVPVRDAQRLAEAARVGMRAGALRAHGYRGAP